MADDITMTKDALYARLNQATSADDLDALEEDAISIGYKPNGIFLRTLTERRGTFAKATRRKS